MFQKFRHEIRNGQVLFALQHFVAVCVSYNMPLDIHIDHIDANFNGTDKLNELE